MTNEIKFAGNLEQALIEFDPFYSGYNVQGSMTFGCGVTPCYMPSVIRRRNMETIKSLEVANA